MRKTASLARLAQAGRIQVLSGREPGEKLVIGGHEKLKDGMEVRVAEPAKGQPKGGATTKASTTKGRGAL